MSNYTGNFRNKDGQLDVYALNCGYLQICEGNGIDITLWAESYMHVRAYDDHRNRLFWESFDNLTEARAFFWRKVKELCSLTRAEGIEQINRRK